MWQNDPVAFGIERTDALVGIYSKAAVVWARLPTECSQNPYLNCGHVEAVFSKPLLALFDIKENPEKERTLTLSVYAINDEHNRAMARIFAEVEGTRVTFSITSVSGSENGGRRLRVERTFPDGTGDINQVKGDGVFIEALDELVEFKKIAETDKNLLCGTCSVKVDGLPGSEV